ncbi:3-oxoacyl-[acyl-carrier protein] reductase [Pseudonocardia hierapolitana]|uniref:3-oxoacyl-[acyl-carrier protein] reductase n=1 Tax=Pseudonocardia hierapolitana TaxID=1128676 RepID=A0A561SIK9_9PSEU|nr:SDR family NAD(P)-dependent oxidoreductase [Pseudonocardia hierapolitana]TWF74719.1 3-oxoacyl-[acyl-carrier protein] reductase [Pseudonocardia hierapolitana]
MELTGKVAVVTGAAVGIGRALARRLGAEGCAVVVADVDAENGARTAELIGPTAVFVPVDVRSDGDLSAMVAAAVDRFGGLHVLINNAGGGGHIGPHFPDAPAAVWAAKLELNLTSAMRATQLALAPMRTSGGGAVVNVASVAGVDAEAHRSPEYAAAKAGLIRFTTAAGTWPGARVNGVVPGWIATERAAAELAAMTPAARAAAPIPVPMDEVADVVVELVRDDAAAGRIVVLPDRARG